MSDYEVCSEGTMPLTVRKNEQNRGHHGNLKSFDLRVLTHNCTEREHQLKTHHKLREVHGEHDCSAGLVKISAVDLRSE